MLGSLVCLLLLQSPTITLTQTAVPLPQLLKEVGAQVGANLQCSDSLKNDIVAVRLNHCTLADFKTQLALAECADWSQVGSADSISLSSEKETAAEQVYWAKVGSTVETSLKHLVNARGTGDSSDNYFTSPEREILAIGAVNFVQTGPYNRLVFSNKPTARQIQLSASAEQIINSKLIPNLAMLSFGKVSSGPIAKYDVVISRQVFSTYDFQFNFYGTDGATVASVKRSSGDGANLPVKVIQAHPKSHPSKVHPSKVKHPTAEPGHKITLSPDAQLYVANFPLVGSNTNGPEDESRQFEKFVALVSHPLKVDPLTWVSDGINKSAAALRKNLIAVIPDSAYNLAYLLIKQDLTAEKLFASSNEYGFMKAEEGDWIRLRPSNPSQARERRVSRESLQDLVDYLESHPNLNIVAFSQFASALGPLADPNLFMLNFVETFRPACFMLIAYQSLDFLALYGDLTDEQRHQLEAGGTLSLPALTPAAQDQVTKMLYSNSIPLSVEVAQSDNNEMAKLEAELMPEDSLTYVPGTGPVKGIKAEPTELFPNGLPASTTLSAQMPTEKVYQMVFDSSVSKEDAMGLEQMGFTASQVAANFFGPDNAAQLGSGPVMGLRSGVRKFLNIRIQVSDNEFLTGAIYNDTFNPTTSAETFAEFKKNNKAELDNLKKIFEKFSTSQNGPKRSGQGTTPP